MSLRDGQCGLVDGQSDGRESQLAVPIHGLQPNLVLGITRRLPRKYSQVYRVIDVGNFVKKQQHVVISAIRSCKSAPLDCQSEKGCIRVFFDVNRCMSSSQDTVLPSIHPGHVPKPSVSRGCTCMVNGPYDSIYLSSLARHCHAAYMQADDNTRRLFNQELFSKIYIDEDDITREQSLRVDYNEPFDHLLHAW